MMSGEEARQLVGAHPSERSATSTPPSSSSLPSRTPCTTSIFPTAPAPSGRTLILGSKLFSSGSDSSSCSSVSSPSRDGVTRSSSDCAPTDSDSHSPMPVVIEAFALVWLRVGEGDERTTLGACIVGDLILVASQSREYDAREVEEREGDIGAEAAVAEEEEKSGKDEGDMETVADAFLSLLG